MRVTQQSTYRLLETNLQRINQRLQTLYNQGTSGSKLNVASDDPTAIRPVLTTRTQLSQTDRYLTTMGVTQDKMQTTDSQMANIENILQRAKELGINAVNSSLNGDDLNSIADEIAELRSQLLDSANATIDGKYVFAGYQENVKPFSANPNYDPAAYDPANSTTWPYIYNGDANPTQLEISPGEYVTTTLTGNELFLGVSNSNWVNGQTAAGGGQPEQNRIDIFSVLTRMEEAVRAGNFSDENGPGGGIQQQTGNLETAANQERQLRSQMGARASRVQASISYQQNAKIDLQQLLSRYQDIDVIDNYSAIAKQETALQAALSLTAKVSSISILDYM
jgi:flagellar hook-associated protein 3 FlgL